MATKTTYPTAIASNLIVNLDANATPATNVTAGTGSVYTVVVDATKNVATAAIPGAYLKVSDTTSVSIGTTAPSLVFYVPYGQISTFIIPRGWAFAVGLSFWCVTGAGLNDAVSPSADIRVSILAS